MHCTEWRIDTTITCTLAYLFKYSTLPTYFKPTGVLPYISIGHKLSVSLDYCDFTICLILVFMQYTIMHDIVILMDIHYYMLPVELEPLPIGPYVPFITKNLVTAPTKFLFYVEY